MMKGPWNPRFLHSPDTHDLRRKSPKSQQLAGIRRLLRTPDKREVGALSLPRPISEMLPRLISVDQAGFSYPESVDTSGCLQAA